ncbi:MAG: molybdenum cofactor guanylyltransferase [Pyrinomonadaceae bacterium]
MFDGYVLVGGKSGRMGADKALLRLGNKTFAEIAVAAITEIAAGRVTFVVNKARDKQINSHLPVGVPQISDALPDKAALGGIYTALADSKSEWTVVSACDYPFATKNLFAKFAEIAQSVSLQTAAIIPVQPDKRTQPLCALYRAEICLPAALGLLKEKEVLPARKLSENVSTRYIYFDELKNLSGSKFFFFNVNTPADYRQAQKIYRKTL